MFHRSARLFLRPPFEEDARELTAAIADKAIVRNLARVPWPYTEDDARAWMGAPRDPKYPSLLITSALEGRIVGGCGLHEGEDGPELGYWVARQHWGKGVATEAAAGMVQIAKLLGHDKIVALHAKDNPNSARVLSKLGFESTGRSGSMFSLGRGSVVPTAEYVMRLEAMELAAQAA